MTGKPLTMEPYRVVLNRKRRQTYAAARAAGLCVSCKARPRVPHERFNLFCAHCLARYLRWEPRRRAVPR